MAIRAQSKWQTTGDAATQTLKSPRAQFIGEAPMSCAAAPATPRAANARSSWSWAGLIPRAAGRISAAHRHLSKELRRLVGVLAPLQVPKMPLAEPPPRDSRFGSPLKLSRVHWVRRRSFDPFPIRLGNK